MKRRTKKKPTKRRSSNPSARNSPSSLHPPGDRWWADSDASVEVTVFPIDVREDPSPPPPSFEFSLEFDLADRSPLEPAWLERLQAAGWKR